MKTIHFEFTRDLFKTELSNLIGKLYDTLGIKVDCSNRHFFIEK